MTSPESDRDEQKNGDRTCPVFGVESGAPIIGLGLLSILFGIAPVFLGTGQVFQFPAILTFTGFGIFLTWLGLKK